MTQLILTQELLSQLCWSSWEAPSPQSLCVGLGWSLSTVNPQKTNSKPSLLPDTRVQPYPPALSEASQHTLTDLSNMTPTLSTVKQ